MRRIDALWGLIGIALLFPLYSLAQGQPTASPTPKAAGLFFATNTPQVSELLVSPTAPAATEKVIYLTFDDGPDPEWTPKVLALLEEHAAEATFFVVGRSAEKYADQTLLIYEAGHCLANHSWDHSSLAGLSKDDFIYQVLSTELTLSEVTPLERKTMPKLLRPPYGEWDADTADFAFEFGYEIVLWDVDSGDWRSSDVAGVANQVLDHVQPGDIVLMHDGGTDRSVSVAALEIILDQLSADGWQYEKLCEHPALDAEIEASPTATKSQGA